MAKPYKNKQKNNTTNNNTTSTAVFIPRPAPAAPIIRSMEQYRAAFALTEIETVLNEGNEERKKEVRRYLNSLPALIRINGLGQALAFFRMKGEMSSHEYIYQIIGRWLCNPQNKGCIFRGEPTPTDVLTAITRGSVFDYMAAQNETLALLEWLKKFAVALLPSE